MRPYHIIPILFVFLIFLPSLSDAADMGLERDLQRALEESRSIINRAMDKLTKGSPITSELTALKAIAEDIRASHLLLQERFRLREEKVMNLGEKAPERHGVMSEGYMGAIEEYLRLMHDLPPEEEITDPILEELKAFLDRILYKQKTLIFGSLPYRNLNYPAREPTYTPSIKPAYKGGDKTVSPDDLKSTNEAPITEEIATLAESLEWNPVLIYEWVKNTIETEWYWGCMKGAEETWRQESGNDCDQAALLIALLRASGFPSRYVRGVIEFFPDIEKVKNLTGIEDPQKIAEFFQKAGIPYKPLVKGGQIANFQIEHIWVESQIPFANFHGTVVDEYGKAWLGLDASIKVTGYTYNDPIDILEEVSLSGIRDEYLSAVQAETPLEYIKTKIEDYLQLSGLGSQLSDFYQTKTLIPEVLNLLPASLQYRQISFTHEYTEIPDELIHKIRFIATDTSNNELFHITLETPKLSNQQIAVSIEPETREDHELINSYGGLGNTPAYLVGLRPALNVNGENVAVSTDGLPIGAEYTLTMELISPNGVQKVTNTHITGNYAVIGIVSGRAVIPEAVPDEERDAGRLLYEEAMSYVDRWNQAEEELASLMHLTITRPVPTVVTLGGVMDVTYLLDTPHGFDWKGVYVDADLKVIESVESSAPGAEDERQKDFIRLSSLEGSILENRIFEDDFQVESISTAKLFGLANTSGTPILTIDSNNIDSLLPTLPFAEAIKEDITNGVNQGLTVEIPQSEITYEDWTGTGYIKKDPETGESGWMLSGMIAGGMTAIGLAEWSDSLKGKFKNPHSGPPSYDPISAVYIKKVVPTDLQKGTVGEELPKALEVIVYDIKGTAVKGVDVTFSVKAGGGKLSQYANATIKLSEITVKTDDKGAAAAILTLGEKTGDNPTYVRKKGDVFSQQVGENIVDAKMVKGAGISKPFTAYAFPKGPSKMTKLFGDGMRGKILNFSSFVSLSVEDEYGNPLSNQTVEFSLPAPKVLSTCSNPNQDTRPAQLIEEDDQCLDLIPTWGECASGGSKLTVTTTYRGASAHIILGGTPNAEYPIEATTTYIDENNNQKQLTTTFHRYSHSFGSCNDPEAPPSDLIHLEFIFPSDIYGYNINAAKVGEEIPLLARLYYLREGAKTETEVLFCPELVNCPKIVGSRSYAIDTNFKNAKVTFTGLKGTALGSGLFKANWKLSSGLNTVTINGDGTVSRSKSKNSCSQSPRCLTVDEDVQQQTTKTLYLYGVDVTAELGPEKTILVNEEGYTSKDYTITTDITPAQYQAQTAYVVILKDGVPETYVKTEQYGKSTVTLLKGYWFDSKASYQAEVVLNHGRMHEGRSLEIRSQRIPLNVTAIKANLEVYMPRVVDSAESMIPEADEWAKGSVSFLNLDNDDNDAKFDYDGQSSHDDVVTGGDDELVKIKLKLNRKDLSVGSVKLKAIAGGGTIKVWKKKDKATASVYKLGDTLSVPKDFNVEGDSLVKEMWIEGIKPHTKPNQTLLEMYYELEGSVVSVDGISLTIVGIDKIEWVGKNNSLNNNNDLDLDPNWPSWPPFLFVPPPGVRVFPDARMVGGTVEANLRNKVDVKVTLTVHPPQPIKIYLKPFDIDDPSSNKGPVDDPGANTSEDKAEDNRGTSPGRAGQFAGVSAGAIKALSFSANEKVKTAEFTVTMQPGDNFRVCGTGDKDFIARLENNDSVLNVGATDQDKDINKQLIINIDVSGTPDKKEVREARSYCSRTLTVWRFLHVEVDSMGNVTGNQASGNITGLNTNSNTTATGVTVDNNLGDKSKDLDDSPAENGRFEKGTLSVGGTATVIKDLDGNGNQRIEKALGMNIVSTLLFFAAQDNDPTGGSTMIGTVKGITKSGARWTLKLSVLTHSETPIDWADFVGGTITIGGGPNMSITSTSAANTSVEVAGLRIPYTLTDDDKITGNVPAPDTSMLAPAFQPAYVMPRFDVGDNNTNVPFVANIDPAEGKGVYDFDARGTEANSRFWTIYILGAYQAETDADADPDTEGMTMGIVDDLNGEGVKIFMETVKDDLPNPKFSEEAATTVHETGHLFNGEHDDCSPGDAGIMATDINTPSFCPESLNKIRSIAHP